MQQQKDYSNPFNGYYVKLPCNNQYKHESEVAALSLSIDVKKGVEAEKVRETLTYICPVCKVQHVSLLEG